MTAYMVVYRPEYLLRREKKAGHLPYGHLEVHLGEFEQPRAMSPSLVTGINLTLRIFWARTWPPREDQLQFHR